MESFTVNAILRRNVYRHPRKVALIFGEERFTFRQLDERINGLINGLSSLGIEKGDRVGIYSHNHGRYIEVLYAAAKGGFVLCTINALLKEKELVHVLQDFRQPALVEEYIAGQFYRRELPCIMAILRIIEEKIHTVIIDGYVDLG